MKMLVSDTISMVLAYTLFEDRLTRLDIRFAKTFQVRRTRLRGMLDIYNFLNGNAVTGVNNAYSPVGITWRRPSAVQGPRLFKIGMQLEF